MAIRKPVEGADFEGRRRRRVRREDWGGSEKKETRHPFAGKMAEEKLASFSFIFERTPPHRPVWTLAGLSFVASTPAGVVERGWYI